MAKAYDIRSARAGGVADALGVPRRKDLSTDMGLVGAVRDGLPFSSFEAVSRAAGLAQDEAARALGLAPRTLARRKVENRLDSQSSERVVRLARVVTRAEEVLGDEEAMQAWLRAPNRALGGQTPLSLLDTDVGTQAVLTVLGRLEHGVFS